MLYEYKKMNQQSKRQNEGQERLLTILRRHNSNFDTLCRDWRRAMGRRQGIAVKKFDKLKNCDIV